MRSVFLFQDLKLPGRDYHTSLGAVRTKPGRGDPTRSLSCSDKLLKWRALGLQVMRREYTVHSTQFCETTVPRLRDSACFPPLATR